MIAIYLILRSAAGTRLGHSNGLTCSVLKVTGKPRGLSKRRGASLTKANLQLPSNLLGRASERRRMPAHVMSMVLNQQALAPYIRNQMLGGRTSPEVSG